jgi:hypothetical protein
MLTVEEALKILKQYSCLDNQEITSEIEKKQLREAILLVSGLSTYDNLGVCADNLQAGLTALASYVKALGYKTQIPPTNTSSDNHPVYIKFNGKTMGYYLDAYQGSYRGVLISCQSEDDNIAGTYGHFPLNLFS